PGGKKTKSGGFSTNERVLRDIMKSHPAVEKILEYRELNKLNSTYTFALIDKVNKKTNRIHANFNQAVTSTGRLSSNNPNLQNIPISSEKANKIRKAFEADEGNVLLGLDIAQQELRVVSVLSREEKLIQAFKNSQDIHALTASEVFGIPIESVDSEKRRVGKTLNFSLLYGISAFGLSDRLKMSREESQEMIDKFWQGYPNIKKYFDNLLLEAREKGYAETYFGRRRSAAGLSSKNFQIRSATEREIINFPIQGTSAELMKLAMIAVDEYIDENELELNPKIILQVHDELILEIKNISEKKTAELAGILKARMEGVIDFEVPLLVEPKTGHDWSNMKNINI
ncbi:MAG TPA: DNA polymerase, partial [Candidatus Dojkabacteria bacterium]